MWAGGRPCEAEQHLDRCRFARTIASKKPVDRAARDVQIQFAHSTHLPVGLRQDISRNRRLHHRCTSSFASSSCTRSKISVSLRPSCVPSTAICRAYGCRRRILSDFKKRGWPAETKVPPPGTVVIVPS